jgi:hypothetical protein
MNKLLLSFPITALVFVLLSQPLLGQGPVVWVPSSTLIRVSPTENPGSGTSAQIHAVRGEIQSFQVAVHAPEAGLTAVTFSVTDLIHCAQSEDGTSNCQTIPQTDLVLFREKYMNVRQHSPTRNGPPNLPITNINTFPDALIPFIDPLRNL